MKLTYRKTYERCARRAGYTSHDRRVFRRIVRHMDRKMIADMTNFCGGIGQARDFTAMTVNAGILRAFGYGEQG